ncbi:MAG: 50S ribosomal protein L13 [Candidatus Cloacimonas sp.]|nr:50S ribosomal protein L13 [Candidatus Cloacimonadota bacterium]
MRTLTPKKDQIVQDWFLIDAEGQTLGRLSTNIARILRGKNKPYFVPHIDTGDYVVVINADKVKLTGNKELQKTYKSYSGYPGGLKITPFLKVKEEKPEEIILKAVKGMLPKNPMGRQQLTKLKVYRGSEHPHAAQKPTVLTFNEMEA